ncbi:DUF4309 domain-containing protein [Desertibacillus haloalkaliphilus]|uniref:DUF4309 domain-containing protein n=1 Tax=Desertibacillus haloalkaliphilus TaxID=1328930 RepID=UPI001C274F8D|nr:DUF4309 domain-containing protein [Desertibacillus haloalkaliphilus]MBU8905947.1 DUF4309 domain-containing protein [Desertibacillus haloalkaliphilus]
MQNLLLVLLTGVCLFIFTAFDQVSSLLIEDDRNTVTNVAEESLANIMQELQVKSNSIDGNHSPPQANEQKDIEGSLKIDEEGNRLDNTFIEQLKNGYLPPAKYAIGTSIEKIQEKKGPPLQEGEWRGAPYLSYDNANYFYHPEAGHQVVAIERFIYDSDVTSDDVTKLLGTPDLQDKDLHDGDWLLAYELDHDFDLLFRFTASDGPLFAIELQKRE